MYKLDCLFFGLDRTDERLEDGKLIIVVLKRNLDCIPQTYRTLKTASKLAVPGPSFWVCAKTSGCTPVEQGNLVRFLSVIVGSVGKVSCLRNFKALETE